MCFLHVSLSACGAARTVAYATAVCFLNVPLSVCGAACAVASAHVVSFLNVSLRFCGAERRFPLRLSLVPDMFPSTPGPPAHDDDDDR